MDKEEYQEELGAIMDSALQIWVRLRKLDRILRADYSLLPGDTLAGVGDVIAERLDAIDDTMGLLVEVRENMSWLQEALDE